MTIPICYLDVLYLEIDINRVIQQNKGGQSENIIGKRDKPL